MKIFYYLDAITLKSVFLIQSIKPVSPINLNPLNQRITVNSNI